MAEALGRDIFWDIFQGCLFGMPPLPFVEPDFSQGS